MLVICNITTLLSFNVVGAPVIQSPSEVIFQPNEGLVELVCDRNTTAGSTLWRVNGSSALIPADLVMMFPGHSLNGVNLVIVNATNNTEYICVSAVDNVGLTDSEPVYLYVAGTYVVSLYVTIIIFICFRY